MTQLLIFQVELIPIPEASVFEQTVVSNKQLTAIR